MIGKLTGVIDSYGEDWVIVDVGGVGYQVYCSARTLQALPTVGEATSLAIETYVREDMIRLYGFASDHEREWFRLLMTVQGVGARVALAVLGTLKPGDLATAIALQDKAVLTRAPGVGKKVAERIAAELRDKAPAYSSADRRWCTCRRTLPSIARRGPSPMPSRRSPISATRRCRQVPRWQRLRGRPARGRRRSSSSASA